MVNDIDKLKEKLVSVLNENLVSIVLSNPMNKKGASKIKVRPIELKKEIGFQFTKYEGTQVFHENLSVKEALNVLSDYIANDFKQAQIIATEETITALSNGKGNVTMIVRKVKSERKTPLTHNRKKTYILEEGEAVPFLVDLGVMTRDGKIVQKKYDKFRQINRFLEFVEDILNELPKDREVKILDFGCGKSYLTFAMYYYLKVLKGYAVSMTGLDLKEDVIDNCNELSKKYGYSEGLNFLKGDIADYDGTDKVDMVVTLHACDTATDYALAKAVNWGARVILSVPCCQHELNAQIKNELMAPVFEYGIIKERMSALLTDALRAQYLESRGYKTQILEFIDMEHTPKNLLIRGVLKKEGKNEAILDKVNEIEEFFKLNPTIKGLLK